MHDSSCVSVIIPVWNLWDMTEACLRSLATHSAGENMQVVVVDNHSTDATTTELASLGEALFGTSFKAVRMPENVGFARGCNAGARAADGLKVVVAHFDRDGASLEFVLPQPLAGACRQAQ